MKSLFDVTSAVKPVLPEDQPAVDRLNLLEEIESHGNRRNPKIEIMREHSSLLQDVFRLTYDWKITYGVRRLPRASRKQKPLTPGVQKRWMDFIRLLTSLDDRVLTGNAAMEAISRLWATLSSLEVKWYSRILMRDLRVKIAMGSISKVWPDMIEAWGVQLAPSSPIDIQDLDKLTYPLAVDPKYDGVRMTIVVDRKGRAVIRTRSGKEYSFPHIEADVKQLGPGMYDGEAFASRWNDTAGLFHLDQTKPGAAEKIQTLRFLWFDYLPLRTFENHGLLTYRQRRFLMLRKQRRLKRLALASIEMVPAYRARSPKDVVRLYRRFLQEGHEGAMVKALDGYWMPGRSSDWLKVKSVRTVDAKVIGVTPHRKHKNKLGALVVEYEGRELKVGGGFSDELRRSLWRERESLIGRVIEFRFQDDPTQVALGRFGQFERFRFDKEK